jgi:acetyltransferase-like isoleucine patch superfamily enzyme
VSAPRVVESASDSAAELLPTRAPAQLESTGAGRPHRLFAIRVVNYLTNHVVSHLPSFALRRLWYTRMLGASVGRHAGIHLGCRLWFYGPSQIRRSGFRLGACSRVNRDCRLDLRGGLQIADNVSISPEVTVLTASHLANHPDFPVELRPVVIEDHVWIGTRAMILPGVTLGHGCVVAAGSVVTRDVPPLAIVAGIPARSVGVRAAAATRYVLDNPFPLFE